MDFDSLKHQLLRKVSHHGRITLFLGDGESFCTFSFPLLDTVISFFIKILKQHFTIIGGIGQRSDDTGHGIVDVISK